MAGARRRVATGSTTVLERPTAGTDALDGTGTDVDAPTGAATDAEPEAAEQHALDQHALDQHAPDQLALDQDAQEQPGREDDANAVGAPARRRSRLWVPLVAAVVALGLLAAVLVYSLRPVVSDADRTAAVSSARTTLESLLSYSGSTFDKHVDEVLPQLTSPFKDQFSKVAATDIKPMAVKNEATVQAKVYEAGVMDTSGDGGEGTTVRVMAFVNQATTTKAQPAPAIDQNRVIATMRKTGDRWLISDLSAY